MNNLYDEYLDMLMESENTDDEAKKKAEAKEKRKKYIKAIAAAAAAIAAITAAVAICKKLMAKAPDKETKSNLESLIREALDIEDNIKKQQKDLTKAMNAKKGDLSGGDWKHCESIFDKLQDSLIDYKKITEKINKEERATSVAKDAKFTSKNYGYGDTKKAIKQLIGDQKKGVMDKIDDMGNTKLKLFKNSADDVIYDNLVDAICEKYNDDQIDAETCIKLMERAAERYAVVNTDEVMEDADESYTEGTSCSEYERAVGIITEKCASGEINVEICTELLERAAERYLDED